MRREAGTPDCNALELLQLILHHTVTMSAAVNVTPTAAYKFPGCMHSGANFWHPSGQLQFQLVSGALRKHAQAWSNSKNTSKQ